jgi:exosortase/archaeosortase family protein
VEAKEITTKYIVTYFATLIFFYQLFMWIPSKWIEFLTAQISVKGLTLLGLTSDYGISNNWVWMTLTGGARDVQVYIIRECTAFHVWGILIGLIMPLQEKDWGRKLKSIVFGGGLVFIMNITRIMITLYLTGYDVAPFSWFLINPTIETYHYPVSFAYGVIGIAVVVSLINAYILPELGDFLVVLPKAILRNIQNIVKI